MKNERILTQAPDGNITATQEGHFQSRLDLDRTFTGEYFDDFVLPVLSNGHDSQNILILGGGLGAGVRPILSSGMVGTVDSVEIDHRVTRKASTIFSAHFEHLPVTFISDCAYNYITRTRKKYDVIWVDLFIESGYVDFIDSPRFHEAILKTLKPGGVVAFNAYSLATYLLPYCHAEPVNYLCGKLSRLFRNVSLIPHRKNTTVICRESSSDDCPEKTGEPVVADNMDFRTFQGCRARLAARYVPGAEDIDREVLRFNTVRDLEREVFLNFFTAHADLWRSCPEIFEQGLNPDHAEKIEAIFSALVAARDPDLMVFPVRAAMTLRGKTLLDPNWLWQVTSRHLEGLKKFPKEFLLHHIVANLVSCARTGPSHDSDRNNEVLRGLKCLWS